MSDIDNNQDVIDSRDVIARIEELQGERELLLDSLQDAESDEYAPARRELDDWETEYGQELADLEALAKEAEGYAADWHYGEALIRDSYFTEYAQQFAEDIGAINRDAGWPNSCIDWDEAAAELQQDYTAVDFAGVTYWVR